jgi:DDE superfamily endonuclease
VQAVAQALGIEVLYVPTHAPNLKLIERFWRFVTKQCLYSKYYADRTSFQQAILTCIQQAPTTHQEELEQLLTWRFHTFQDVLVIGDQQTVSKRSKKKVLSKTA